MPSTMRDTAMLSATKNSVPSSKNGRRARRADRREFLRPAVDQQHRAQPVPQPAVAHACGGDHPVTKPSRRAPPVHPPHEAVVALFDESPDGPRDGHRVTPLLRFVRTPRRQPAKLLSRPLSSCQSKRDCFSSLSSLADHFRQKRISFSQCAAVNAGTNAASGISGSVHG